MRPIQLLLPAVSGVLLLACGDKSDDDTGGSATGDEGGDDELDADGDGFTEAEGDCDDADDAVFPGAEETCNGVDDDCDGAVDAEPVDGIEAWLDADGDGFGAEDQATLVCELTEGLVENGEDCDDLDPDVHPDADELCSTPGVDDDCSGEAEDDPVDGDTWYYDDDADGYGSPTESKVACEQPDEYVADNTDCDDDESQISPHAAEVGCDGVDNDCDGTVDLNTVPGTYATIQEAVDTLSDGQEICLEPGTYTEQVDVTGRTLTITGQGGAEETIFDLSGDLPLFEADNYDWDWEVVGESTGSLTISGATVTGAVDVPVSDWPPFFGGLLGLGGSDGRLEDIVFTEASFTFTESGTFYGGLAAVAGGTLEVDGLEVSDVSAEFVGSTDSERYQVYGLVFGAWDAELVMADIVASGLEATTTGDPDDVYFKGLLAYTYTAEGGASEVDGLELTDSTVALDCERSCYLDAGVLYLSGRGSNSVSNAVVTGNSASVTASSSAYAYGLVRLAGSGGDSAEVMDLSDNDISATNDTSSSYAYGPLNLASFATVSHVTAFNNTVRAEATGSSSSGYAYGGGMHVSSGGELDHIDLRGNEIYGARYAYGGGLAASAYGDPLNLQNFVLAGNSAEAGSESADGGGARLSASGEDIVLRNGDVVSNSVVAGGEARGGGLSLSYGTTYNTSVSNTNVAVNSTSGGSASLGQEVYVGSETALGSWTYNNVYGDADLDFEGMDDPTGTDGNISEDPLYTDTSASDVAAWDLSLMSSSPAIDAGDPSYTDDDGSTCDIGAYGGPDGTAW